MYILQCLIIIHIQRHYKIKELEMLNKIYCVDIDTKSPEVEVIFREDYLVQLREIDSKKLMDLETHDLRLFRSYIDAENFLKGFKKTLDSLKGLKLNAIKDIPKILLKRRYIATSLMGVKKLTTRHYNKNWKKGTIFQLFDQTYFLTAKLTKIEEVVAIDNNNYFTYHYRIVDGKNSKKS